MAAWRRGLAGLRRDLDGFHVGVTRRAGLLAFILSVLIFVVGVTWGTGIAGGADSYGYVSQARLWAGGNLIIEQPIAGTVPWPNADLTFTPLGYKPWTSGHAIVPIYAPGYPMLMALFSVIHPAAVFWVVPLAGAVLVAMAYLLGRALAGAEGGLMTAALTATSPAFLFQLVAPMSDVVVAAFWVAALVLAIPNRRDRWLGSGMASSLAILTRPNTAPIAAVFALAAIAYRTEDSGTRASFGTRVLNVIAYVTGTLPGVFSVAAIHTALYGSPFESGYGSAADLYALRFFPTNIVRYTASLVTSETPVICLAALAPFLVWKSARERWLVSFTGLVASATWLCYLFYQPYEPWWYLRFFITSLPCLLALSSVPLTRVVLAVGAEWRAPLVVAVLVPILILRLDFARRERTFESWKFERRYADAGRAVAERLPANAILFSGQESGSLRYYSGRLTLRWHYLEVAWLERSIQVLKDRGLKPYFVFEEGEEAEFRAFFDASPLGRRNWPAVVELNTSPKVRIYDPDGDGQTP